MAIFTPSEWMILALIFVLGLLIGMFMTAGGRRKWKTRYTDEVRRREELEKEHRESEKHWQSREKELRSSSATTATARDSDRDGVPDRNDRRQVDDRRA